MENVQLQEKVQKLKQVIAEMETAREELKAKAPGKHMGATEEQHTGCIWAEPGCTCWQGNTQPKAPEPAAEPCFCTGDTCHKEEWGCTPWQEPQTEPAAEEKPLSLDIAFVQVYQAMDKAQEQVAKVKAAVDAVSMAERQEHNRSVNLLAEAREKSYSRGFDDGYQQGLTEGREQAPKVGTVQVDVMSLPEVQELIREQSRQIVDAEERAYQAEQQAESRSRTINKLNTMYMNMGQEITRLNQELTNRTALLSKVKEELAQAEDTAIEEVDRLNQELAQAEQAAAKAMAEGLSIGLGFVKALYPDAVIRVEGEGDKLFVEVEVQQPYKEDS